jgi:hypothetical protein
VVEPVREGLDPVSSRRIRGAISAGDLREAAVLLGRAVEIDLAGIAAVPQKGGVFFDTRSGRRIMPPPGTYPVVVYGINFPEGKEAGASITDGGLFIPSVFNADRIEFICKDIGVKR